MLHSCRDRASHHCHVALNPLFCCTAASGNAYGHLTINDCYVVTSRRGEHPERWSWEIRRKSSPLGIKMSGDGFQFDAAAQFAGKRALEDFLSDLSKEKNGSEAASGTSRRFRDLSHMDDLGRRKEEALVYVSLSTATLVVCFSIALALL